MSEAAKGFDVDWLALREPLDRDARAATGLDARLAAWLDARRARRSAERSGDAPGGTVSVVDLGCGSGSNLRHLLPRLGTGQRWRTIDNDPVLLEALEERLGAWARSRGAILETAAAGELRVHGDGFGASVRRERRDLAADLAGLDLAGTDLVTASALLDLCSGDWVDALVAACAHARVAGLFVLDYDGGARFDPPHADDETVRALVNRHQLRDKGFGPALGPAAGARASARFSMAGHDVVAATSLWRAGPDARSLHAAFVDGWAGAASELAPDGRERIEAWRAHRVAAARSGRATLEVSHHDVLALPPDRSSP